MKGDLISLIERLKKKEGHDIADSMLAGILLVKKDYFLIKAEIERILKGVIK
jgi:hypothetical protein